MWVLQCEDFTDEALLGFRADGEVDRGRQRFGASDALLPCDAALPATDGPRDLAAQDGGEPRPQGVV